MKTLPTNIGSCRDCPFFDHFMRKWIPDDNCRTLLCNLAQKTILDIIADGSIPNKVAIPDWCPLPDSAK